MSAESTASSRSLKLVVVAAATVALAAGAYQWIRPSRPLVIDSGVGMQIGGAGWATELASDAAGSARGRQLSLYTPSASTSNYMLEFLGHIERRSLGWVCRAADPSNYYAAQIEAAEPGSARLAITHFSVILGVEGPHIQRPLPPTLNLGSILKVKVEARGPRFKVWVQNHIVDEWQDDQLKTGAVGFFRERGALGKIGSLAISLPEGGPSR